LSLVYCDWLAMGVAVNRRALKKAGQRPAFSSVYCPIV